MEDNYQVQDTEVEIERDESENKGPSIREALTQHLEQSGQTETEVKAESEPQQEVNNEVQTVHSVNRPVLLPPADMRAEEKDAFLNPTPDNAHILQNYLNRRAYETRSDYSRKMTEVEDLKRRTSGLYDSIKEYEQVYARQGVSLGDIAKRSIAWDQAMQKAPVQTALEWLESYGLTLQELTNQTPENEHYEPQTQSRYLTKEEAERIAEERIEAVMKQQEQKAVELFNQRVVESFMNTKPVFRDPETASQIESEMAPIVSALTGTGRYNSPEEILETAYNYVINGNPVYSSLVRQMTAKPMIEQKQAVAQQAKAASRSISGSPGSGTPRLEVKDLRENLRRRFIGDD